MPNEVDTLFCPSRPSLGFPLLEIQEGAPQMKQRGVSEHEAGKAGQNQAGLSLVFHASRSLDFILKVMVNSWTILRHQLTWEASCTLQQKEHRI